MAEVTVRVPATTANLGPGFDSFGCALGLYNTLTFREIQEGLSVTGCPEAYQNRDNLAVRAYEAAMERLGRPVAGLGLHIEAEIPVSRGLGSSSAMILGGVLAANHLAGGTLTREDVLEVGTELEGHPDNLAPALYGGLTASMMEGGRPVTASFPLWEKLQFVVLIPDFPLSTAQAREVLPRQVDFQDAVFNVSRGALVLSALGSGDLDLLGRAMDDRLHQPYRRSLIPGIDLAEMAAYSSGAAAFCVSGAGPTCLALGASPRLREDIAAAMAEVLPSWRVLPLLPDREGAVIL